MKKTDQAKALILEHLRKTPIVEAACQKAGISRMTFYRWRRDDPAFAAATDEALHDGALLVNDLAESQLMAAIRDRNMTAIIFWLRSHHRGYANKLEVNAKIDSLNQPLTAEQRAIVEQALRLASLVSPELPAGNQPIPYGEPDQPAAEHAGASQPPDPGAA